MEKDYLVRRSAKGDEALRTGQLDRKALNILRLGQEAVFCSTFRHNLRNYGDVYALIEQLIEDGYMERVGNGQRAAKGKTWRRLMGFGKRSAAASAATDDQGSDPHPNSGGPAGGSNTTPADTQAIKDPSKDTAANEADFGSLPLPDVTEGFTAEDPEEAEAPPAPPSRTVEQWQQEEVSADEADLLARYTNLNSSSKG